MKMATFESNVFCSLEEYNGNRENRIYENELVQGELYVASLALEPNFIFGPKMFAAKIAARLVTLGNGTVELCFQTEDLEDEATGSAPITDGIIRGVNGVHIFQKGNEKRKYHISEAYFRDYDDGLWDNVLKQCVSYGDFARLEQPA